MHVMYFGGVLIAATAPSLQIIPRATELVHHLTELFFVFVKDGRVACQAVDTHFIVALDIRKSLPCQWE